MEDKKYIAKKSEKMLVEAFQMLNRVAVVGKANIFNLGNAMTHIENVVKQINEQQEESSTEEK